MKKYKNKGLRKTSIKTIYGEVTYRRRVYETEDGGPWIRDPYDDEVIYQLDRFHIQQGIIRQIKDKEARKEISR